VEALHPYPALALALVTGLLIGLEREQSKPPASDKNRGFSGGVRTYPLFALLGAIASLLHERYGALPVLGASVGLSAFLAIGYWRDAEHGHAGLTSEASALLTFFLGALATSEGVIEPVRARIFVVLSVAVVATFLLSQKTVLRALSSKLSRDDVIGTLKFLLIAVVVLPVLPNRPMGPYGALNPFHIGLMVLLIAGISFVGYVAMRVFGHGRGLLITGAIGGLVSSTAVTLASAARAKQTPALATTSALAVLIANGIMLIRVLVVVAATEPSLLSTIAVPIGAMASVNVAALGVLAFRDRAHRNTPSDVALANPFELMRAFQFAAFFVLILVASRWASSEFGATGSYLTALFAGLSDVDAVTLSTANAVSSGALEETIGVRSIVIAVASNTVTKSVMAVALGGWLFARRIVFISAFALATGFAVAAFGR
jgi:uncharacterized membrane protein (DUF4010 family)